METMHSGCEVESATFHAPVVGGTIASSPARSGWRGKVDVLTSRGMSKMQSIQRGLGERRAMVGQSMNVKMSQVQGSMRNSPMLWAGIAAGTGFGLGLIGRIAHWRSMRRSMPDLVIIEASC